MEVKSRLTTLLEDTAANITWGLDSTFAKMKMVSYTYTHDTRTQEGTRTRTEHDYEELNTQHNPSPSPNPNPNTNTNLNPNPTRARVRTRTRTPNPEPRTPNPEHVKSTNRNKLKHRTQGRGVNAQYHNELSRKRLYRFRSPLRGYMRLAKNLQRHFRSYSCKRYIYGELTRKEQKESNTWV